MVDRRIVNVTKRIAYLALPAFLAMPAAAFATIAGPGSSQPQAAAPSAGTLIAQEGPFQRRMEERRGHRLREVERELEQNPNLVNDPKYLEKHPKLAEYLKNHPEAKSKIEKDPKAFFRHFNNMRSERMD